MTIIYIHRGNSFYLLPNILNARKYNPDVRIILLGDKKNCYLLKYGIEHYIIDEYMSEANLFSNIYIHCSPNTINFELFCFQRWFIINEFVKKKQIEHFLVCDTDAFIFCNVNVEMEKYKHTDFTITRNGTPCFVYLSSKNLQKFTEYITWCYSSEKGKSRIKNYYNQLKKKNSNYGISDMSAFVGWEYFDNAHPLHIDTPYENTAYDHNYTDVNDGYEMINGHKKTIWRQGLPYQYHLASNTWVRIKGIHLQGRGKFMLHQVVDTKYIRPVLFSYLHELIRYRLRKLKNSIILNKL